MEIHIFFIVIGLGLDVIGALLIIGPVRNRRRLGERASDIVDRSITNLKENEENLKSFYNSHRTQIPK